MAVDIYVGELYQPELIGDQDTPLVGDRGGVPVCVWPKVAPHALLVSQTGAGKTTLLRVMVLDLLQDSLPKYLLLGDGKQIGSFVMFESETGVKCSAEGSRDGTSYTEAQSIVYMVEDVHAELLKRVALWKQYRRNAAKSRGAPPWKPPPPLYLFIDEYIGWLLLLDGDVAADIVKKLGLILFQGREVGIRVLLAMQTCHAKAFDTGLSSVMKMNMDARIGVPGLLGFTKLQAQMLYDDQTAKDRIPAEVGGGLLKIGGAEVQFTVPDYPDPTAPGMNLSREDRMRLWGALPSVGSRMRWTDRLEPER